MSGWEWFLVVAINAAIIAFGLWHGRGTTRSVDWFLAARGLPWWMIGLSMFATAVDSGDYVAVAGHAYRDGMSYITSWWLGISIGWILLAFVVLRPMYRGGMFTNAEYLERRFGPTARVISVLVQVQYRTNVLGNVAFSLYLTFNVLTGWGPATWWLVVAIAAGAAAYTAIGGLKSVVLTDSIQAVVMLVAAVVIWVIIYREVGGFEGLDRRMAAAGVTEQVSDAMRHVGQPQDSGAPAWLIVAGWIITLSAYCIVNHSQSMRLLAARSEWDLRMAAVLAGVVTAGVMWFNVTLGILGRGIEPNLAESRMDELFPQLLKQFVVPLEGGLAGIVVAGLLAGGISTFDSIGSALSAVFTRDLYARFLVRDADDRHYLRVSRIVTFVVIGLSFGYVPFMEVGMVKLYIKLIGVAVLPLMTVYLAGVLTPAHRAAGAVGLVAGVACGLGRLASSLLDERGVLDLPTWWTNDWWAFPWIIGMTALAILLTTLVLGRASQAELQGLVTWLPEPPDRDTTVPVTWLERSAVEMAGEPGREEIEAADRGMPLWKRPGLWAILLVALLAWFNLVLMW